MPSARAPTGADGIIFPVLRIRFPIMTQITLETTANGRWEGGGSRGAGGGGGGGYVWRREQKVGNAAMSFPQYSPQKIRRLLDFIRDARPA